MGRQRVKAVGQFAWQNADLGVECRRCGLITVYCDFDALDCFHERGWSLAVADAVKRFRCRCGSLDLHLLPIPIFKRPRPVPARPAALRPIYREERCSLLFRGPRPFPDVGTIEAALDTVRAAIAARAARAEPPEVAEAVTLLRPHIYRQQEADELIRALARGRDALLGMQAAHQAFNGVLRQLGRPTE